MKYSWTKKLPSIPGFYWWRNPNAKYEDDRKATIYEVRNYVDQLSIGNCSIQGSHFSKGEWAGPIEEPIEKEQS